MNENIMPDSLQTLFLGVVRRGVEMDFFFFCEKVQDFLCFMLWTKLCTPVAGGIGRYQIIGKWKLPCDTTLNIGILAYM